VDRLRALGARWPWFDRALDLHQRVGEINGGSLASSVTLTVFVSLFPLALAAIAIIGFLAAGDPDVPNRIIDALSLEGDAATTTRDAIERAADSRRAATVIGVVGLLWSGLGVTNAIALAVQTPWQVKVAGLRTRLDGVFWLLGGVVLVAASGALGAVLNVIPEAAPKILLSIGVIVVGVAVEVGFFLWTFWILGDRRVPWRSLLPGALLGAIGLEVLKLAATVYLPRLVSGSSSLYGPIGVVFAILAWLALFARLLVYSSTLNALLHERRAGTVTLEIQAPRIDPAVPVEADRGGAAVPREPTPSD